ncbi:sugar transferase [Parendozoicomonas sp. Alg238-R29]|uniref:sugar transferase n=1 Tax=Parendozoicomonas sp. Alg238-R29 TaxID=2993446 RepID=UPI00248F18E2|nr:sugar transferase [Parendozoicomonas sp. Alg238-R29]
MNKLNRYDKWYELIFLTKWFRLLVGVVCLVAVMFSIKSTLHQEFLTKESVRNSVVFLLFGYLFSDVLISRLSKFPGVVSVSYTVPVVLIIYFLLFGVFFLYRFEYSRSLIIPSMFLIVFYSFAVSLIIRRYKVLKIAVVPYGDALRLTDLHGVSWRLLKKPSIDNVRYDAVVADFNHPMVGEWEKFLSDCALSGLITINSLQLYESLEGRVKIGHLSEGQVGSLNPPELYVLFKRIIDVVAVLLVFPIVLLVTLISAVIIRLESPGNPFFVQKRVGLGGNEFKIFKLRSMCIDSEVDGAKFAASGDMRVTKFGKFIRKTRIDELPQFLNVLKGEMSLIGPRPEQKAFVSEFEKSIPFYNYRHVVRPGISGWAQVTHGYAASEDETREKLEHDLYYIKHFSLWLDILIVFKTIHTMLTGFGAR